jgi:hypothetical protein
MERVENEFDTGRDAQLIEDPEEIFFYGMLAEREFLCDLTVGKPLGHPGDHLLLSWADQHSPLLFTTRNDGT